MSVNNKHLSTLLFGAAAAFGAGKYLNMTDEEKQKLANTLKEKAHKLKDEAESSVDKAKDYFNDLKSKASEALKEHFPDAEKYFHDLFQKTETNEGSTSPGMTGDVAPGTTTAKGL